MVAVSFNIFVNPIALEAIAWKYYIVFVAVLVGGTFVCYFYYPETRGYTLEEIAVVFDGDEAEVPSLAVTKEDTAPDHEKTTSVSHVEIF